VNKTSARARGLEEKENRPRGSRRRLWGRGTEEKNQFPNLQRKGGRARVDMFKARRGEDRAVASMKKFEKKDAKKREALWQASSRGGIRSSDVIGGVIRIREKKGETQKKLRRKTEGNRGDPGGREVFSGLSFYEPTGARGSEGGKGGLIYQQRHGERKGSFSKRGTFWLEGGGKKGKSSSQKKLAFPFGGGDEKKASLAIWHN